MPRELDIRSTVISLWFRLITIGIIGLVFAEALVLGSGKAQGWTFYLTSAEVAFEVIVRLVFVALVGIALRYYLHRRHHPISLVLQVMA